MEVTYELEAKDLIAFQRYAYRNAPAIKMVRRIMVVGFGSWFLYDFVTVRASLYERAALFVFSCVFTFAFIGGFQALINAYVFRRSIPKRANNGMTGRHKIILAAQEIVEITSVNEMHSLWRGIDRVVQNDDYIFIYLAPNNAHVIPKRAFADAHEAAQFYAEAVNYKAAAQDSTGANPSEIYLARKLSPQPVEPFDANALSPVERLFSE